MEAMVPRARARRIDFREVPKEVRRQATRIPEGDYLCKIIAVEERTSERSGSDYYSWKFQVISNGRGDKKHAGVPLWLNTSLQKKAAFALRNLIYAASEGKKNVAGSVASIDPNKLIGRTIGVTVEDNEYEGRIRSQPADVMPASQLETEEEDAAEETEDEEEEEVEEDEDELEDVDLDEDV
jgi:hypothetical protein